MARSERRTEKHRGPTDPRLRQKDCHQAVRKGERALSELPDGTVCTVDAATGAEIGPSRNESFDRRLSWPAGALPGALRVPGLQEPRGTVNGRWRSRAGLVAFLVGFESLVVLLGLGRPYWGDEAHFVQTIRRFADGITLDTLRHYPEMSTPLPFVLYAVWG